MMLIWMKYSIMPVSTKINFWEKKWVVLGPKLPLLPLAVLNTSSLIIYDEEEELNWFEYLMDGEYLLKDYTKSPP